MHRQHLRSRPDSRGGPPHGAHRLALVAAPLGRHQFPLESRFGRDQAQVRIQLQRKSSRHPGPCSAPVIPPSRHGRRQIRSGWFENRGRQSPGRPSRKACDQLVSAESISTPSCCPSGCSSRCSGEDSSATRALRRWGGHSCLPLLTLSLTSLGRNTLARDFCDQT